MDNIKKISSQVLFDKVKMVVPPDIYFEIIGTLERFSINTVLRAAHFISQCIHESANFSFASENLNYSAIGLINIFSKYFPSMDIAQAYARHPEKIANRVYANRLENGDEPSGDGWKFRGRGYIQITGKSNYAAFSKDIDETIIIENPDIVSTGKYRSLSAGWFWNKSNLNVVADKGADAIVVQEVTKKINGGLVGITDRIKKFNEIYSKIN